MGQDSHLPAHYFPTFGGGKGISSKVGIHHHRYKEGKCVKEIKYVKIQQETINLSCLSVLPRLMALDGGCEVSRHNIKLSDAKLKVRGMMGKSSSLCGISMMSSSQETISVHKSTREVSNAGLFNLSMGCELVFFILQVDYFPI